MAWAHMAGLVPVPALPTLIPPVSLCPDSPYLLAYLPLHTCLYALACYLYCCCTWLPHASTPVSLSPTSVCPCFTPPRFGSSPLITMHHCDPPPCLPRHIQPVPTPHAGMNTAAGSLTCTCMLLLTLKATLLAYPALPVCPVMSPGHLPSHVIDAPWLQVYKAKMGGQLDVAVKTIHREHVNPHLTAHQALEAIAKVPRISHFCCLDASQVPMPTSHAAVLLCPTLRLMFVNQCNCRSSGFWR